MREIRELHEDELDEFVAVSVNAYPGMRVATAEERQRMRERHAAGASDGRFALYGVFEAGHVVGVMRYHDFRMHLLSTRTLVGGIGGVAVDLRHKKEKVAFDMLRHFHAHYRSRGACLVALYPFRPDFYRRMGYGYGAPVTCFRLSPLGLPAGPKGAVDFLCPGDADALARCYERHVERTNGLFERPDGVWERAFADPGFRVVGVRRDGAIGGYATFRFRLGPEDNFIKHDLQLLEVVYDAPADLAALLAFLRSQADQVGRVLWSTQDPDVHVLFDDPRDGTDNLLPGILAHETAAQGLGIMYRVIDVPRLFEVLADHDFNGQTVRIRLTVADDFLPDNAGTWLLRLAGGRARLGGDGACDVEVAIGVAAFSSLVVGAVRLRSLAAYGLAAVSDGAWTAVLDRAFAAPAPQCLTGF